MKLTAQLHLESVNLLRGLAALTVGFYHFSSFFLPTDAPLNWAFSKGYLGVEAFFVISGLVIPLSFAQKSYEIGQFFTVFAKRIIRIEPAYWASILIMLSKDTVINLWYSNRLPDYNFYNLFLHFFHANAVMHAPWLRGIYWTLAIDWQFYIVVLLSFALINRREWWIRYPIYAVFGYAHWYMPYEWLGYHVAPFGAGVVLFHYYRGYISQRELAFALPTMILLHWRGFDYTHGLATALCCGVILFVRRAPRFFLWLGKLSYSFYLTHVFSGWAIMSGISMQTQNPWLLSVGVVVALAGSFIFAKYFYDWVEKPTLQWARAFELKIKN